MPAFGTGPSVHFVPMVAPDTPPARNRRGKQAVGLVETAPSGRMSTSDASAPVMAVSIAGVSTACSEDALVSSAEAVHKALATE